MSSSQTWTPEEEDLLRTLVEAERSLSFIAKKLKRTEAAVAGRAYKLGVRFGKPRTQGLAQGWSRSGSGQEGTEDNDFEKLDAGAEAALQRALSLPQGEARSQAMKEAASCAGWPMDWHPALADDLSNCRLVERAEGEGEIIVWQGTLAK